MSSNSRAAFLVVLLTAVFTAGLLRLFRIQFASGEVYPEFSTLRTDPGGTSLLFDSLAHTPGLTVTRSFHPIEFSEEKGVAFILLGLEPEQFGTTAEAYLKPIEQAAGRGNRIIAAMKGNDWGHPEKAAELLKRWQVTLGVDREKDHVHRLYFSQAKDWNVIDKAGPKMLAIEKRFGNGAVVLLAESRAFDNQSSVAMDRLDVVSAAIGPETHLIFDEQHFGIEESVSVVGLARRFRLTGMAIGLTICAALFLWKNMAAFPPPSSTAGDDRFAGRTAFSGLLTLVRRHIPPAELAATCWREWLAANRRHVTPDRIERAESILRGSTDFSLSASGSTDFSLSRGTDDRTLSSVKGGTDDRILSSVKSGRPADPLRIVREIQAILYAKGPL